MCFLMMRILKPFSILVMGYGFYMSRLNGKMKVEMTKKLLKSIKLADFLFV